MRGFFASLSAGCFAALRMTSKNFGKDITERHSDQIVHTLALLDTSIFAPAVVMEMRAEV